MPLKNGSCDFNYFATGRRFPQRALPQNSFARRTPLAPPPDRGAERAVRWALVALCVAALVWRLA